MSACKRTTLVPGLYDEPITQELSQALANVAQRLIEEVALSSDRTRCLTHPLKGRLAALPLQVHATDTLDEVMAGVDARFRKTDSISKPREGVFYCKHYACDLFLVTLEKNEKDARGETMPPLLLGPPGCRTHQGGRPLQIEWELASPMPTRDFQETKRAAG